MSNNDVVLYNATTQFENTGDLLIHKSLLQQLSRFGSVIIDDTNIPLWYIEQLKVKDCTLLSEVATGNVEEAVVEYCKAAKGHQVYYVLGPGHKMGRGWKKAVAKLLYARKLNQLKGKGCRILRFAVSLGPFDRLNALAESVFSRCFYHYSVRDDSSMALAKQYKFSKTSFFPDLAWSYNFTDDFDKNYKVSENDHIVVSIRPNSMGGKVDRDYLGKMLEGLRHVLSNQHLGRMKIFAVYQVEFDKEAAFFIQSSLGGQFNVEVINKRLFIEEAANIYQHAKLVISNRLHVLLLAAKAGAIPLALVDSAKNKKVINIFNDNGLQEFMVKLEEVGQEQSTDKVSPLLTSAIAFKKKVENVISGNARRVDEEIQAIFK